MAATKEATIHRVESREQRKEKMSCAVQPKK
jgi:hypothetical protein